MRTCILAVLITLSLTADAAVEVFTLTDGRSFVGVYDDEAHTLATTIAGREATLAIPAASIAERAPYKAPKAGALAPPVPVRAEPKPMTPAEKAAAERDFAFGQKMRDADRLAAEAAKARRDAAGARADAERKTEEAARHWDAFKKRAAIEGFAVPGEPPETLIVLPRTSGNNRATIEAAASAKAAKAKALELDALAARKDAESAAARDEAGMMPRSGR